MNRNQGRRGLKVTSDEDSLLYLLNKWMPSGIVNNLTGVYAMRKAVAFLCTCLMLVFSTPLFAQEEEEEYPDEESPV